MATLKLIQLPVPPPSYYAATGNVPLAAGTLASSLELSGLGKLGLNAEVLSPDETDVMGDEELACHIAKDEPAFVGFSLYLWNTERSLHLAREIKKKSPKSKIIIGGPEVNHDNPFVLAEEGYDIAVSGEAEHSFAKLMRTLLEKSSLDGVENIAYRNSFGKMGQFSKELSPDFPLTDFPSPYTNGFLKVDPKRSTYLETVRGCKSSCTYCFYPKSSQNLRTLNIEETIKLISSLKEQGAKELVFLDPTFNHRPGFDHFLDAIAEVNSDGQMSMFAELRSEGVTPRLATKLKKAGFNRIELGMQSVNRDTLKRVKRYGDPNKVAEVAKMLAGEGIDLLLDLIIGLPGDKPDDVERGIHFFLEHGLGEWVQAFPLSVLPGTAMRRDAKAEGLDYLMAPPYRIIRTADFSPDQLVESLYLAEDLLDRRLDEFPRPFLCEGDPNIRDRFDFDLDGTDLSELISKSKLPGARHQAVWFFSKNFESKKESIHKLMDIRLATDPFCTMDFVFLADREISMDLIGFLESCVRNASPSYLSRALAHRGENMQRRLILILKKDVSIDPIWKAQIERRESFVIYQEMNSDFASSHAEKLGTTFPFAWISDKSMDEKVWKNLETKSDPETVSFSARSLEKKWSTEVLEYGEN
ncbi:B12-binding domain-containing radical SAM protein [Leptospira sp. 'Mane']|uniref:B12-binding domain-containing radical SAM protein n=1 Tax=Leptospira sp. 'Mane' TaxID=3387407 RepID=UPI00398B7815